MIAALVLGFIVQMTLSPSFLRFILISIMTITTYSLCFYWIGLNEQEKNILRNSFITIKHKIKKK